MKHELDDFHKSAWREIVRVQVERFHEYYSDFFTRNETNEMAKFFFETVYNLDGKEDWENLALSTYDKVKHMMKETSRENVERLMELNSITDELDIKMGVLLIQKGWDGNTQLTLPEYIELYKELGNPELRKKQLEVVLFNLKKFYELAHKPIASYVIKPASMMSKMLGVYPLFEKVEKGFYATLPVKKEVFQEFFNIVEKKEWEFYDMAFPGIRTVS
jgi:thiol-disulfide isomerase/thioredoxin